MSKFIFATILLGAALVIPVGITQAATPTVAQLEAVVSQLQAQVVALTAKLYAVPETDLEIGQEGEKVSSLQRLLIKKGFLTTSSGQATGYFGPATQAALSAYQQANGVKATGYYGPLTRAKLTLDYASASTAGSDSASQANEAPAVSAVVDTAGNMEVAPLANVAAQAATSYTITATAGAGGRIVPSGVTTVRAGANQTYEMRAGNDCQVKGVYIDGALWASASAAAKFTFSAVNANRTIEARFACGNEREYKIGAIAAPPAGGTVTGGGTFRYGAPFTLTATANPGYVFDHWKTPFDVLDTAKIKDNPLTRTAESAYGGDFVAYFTAVGANATTPSATYNVTASRGWKADQISVTWADVDYPLHNLVYKVIRYASSRDLASDSGVIVASVSEGPFVDTKLSSGTSYYYRIRTVDPVTRLYADSAAVLGQTSGTTPITPPTDTPSPSVLPPAPAVQASQNLYSNRVQVSWNSVGAGYVYDLYRTYTPDKPAGSSLEGGAVLVLSDTTATSYDDWNVSPDKRYYYRVGAHVPNGLFTFSATAMGKTMAESSGSGSSGSSGSSDGGSTSGPGK